MPKADMLQEWFGQEDFRSLTDAISILEDGSGPIFVELDDKRVEVWNKTNDNLDIPVGNHRGKFCIVDDQEEKIISCHRTAIKALQVASDIVLRPALSE